MHCLAIIHVSYHFPTLLLLVKPHLDAVKAAKTREDLCERERAYMRSAIGLANGDPTKATDELCDMLLTHPGGTL